MSEAAIPASTPGGARLTAQLSTDARLVRRAAGGDERAFAAIFRRYQQDLYRYCLAILRDPDDAHDALQGTMVKALQALPGERRQIELKPWLYRIAHNESIDLVRRRQAGEQLPAELAAPGAGLAGEAETRERLRTLLADLETLPERQRAALLMRELSGLEFTEIGAALGCSAAVARQTVYEARLGLRQIESGREMRCEQVTEVLSEADGRVRRRRDIRAHLRDCEDCRRFGEEIAGRSRDLAALAPLPALAAGGLLQGIFGGQAGSGLAGGLGGGAAKTLGASAALKATATVAVVALVGGAAAQRADLIHVGPSGDGRTTQRSETESASAVDRLAAPTEPAAVSSPTTDPAASAHLGAARAAEAVRERGGVEQRPPPRTPAAEPPSGPPVETHENNGHPSLPAASAHGQQTAAAHKNAGHGTSGNKGGNGKSSHAASPAKPSHPAHPAKPAKQPSPPKSSSPSTKPGKSGEAASKGGKAEKPAAPAPDEVDAFAE